MNKAGLAAELGNLVNEGVLSLATRNKLLIKSDDAAIPAALKSGDPDVIGAVLPDLSPAEAEALSKLAAKRGSKAAGKADNAAGAGKNLKYEPAPYHTKTGNNVKSSAPTNGQEVLNNSVPIGNNTSRRVGVDKKTGEYVVFDKHADGTYHAHTRPWSGSKGTALTTEMQNALIKAGLTNRKGKMK